MLKIFAPVMVIAVAACAKPTPAEFPPLAAQPAQAPVAPAVESTDPLDALGLTEEEKAIWPTLTKEQQVRAIKFIRAGSTLMSSLGK